MDGVEVKREIEVLNGNNNDYTRTKDVSGVPVIDLDSSDDDSCSSGNRINDGKRSRVLSGGDVVRSNKRKKGADGVVLPAGFLDPLPRKDAALQHAKGNNVSNDRSCKQFWKAGDFEGCSGGDWNTSSGGMDHLRVHPRFLHSNATSHKWVLGAFAELLDNALDEVCNGATYVNIDMLTNKKDENRMLLIEDNGGGMDPDKMRQCISLGYSLKSKVTDAIGQYGNGFKTSTMRLGADVIVFSRCSGKDGKRSTQSIGLLSYTFLRSTGKEDIVVPMLDYERGVQTWKKMKRLSPVDWDTNVEAMVQWSPFSSEADLLRQFDHMKDHGTRIIIYNLWEDDQGQLELDFDADKHDIQIRGVNRDENSIKMAQQYPNSRHFLTYRHSLRSYASILYLRVPYGFRMILRGKDVQHHNIVNDMMMTNEVTYRPQPGVDGVPKDSNMVALVTMGFVKDAKAHIDVQGFNVYHKNRLIKPFWRLWNAAGSDGRGVIGVLEANFVEPAHDKQGFERTNVLSRLEARLVQMQKTYWSTYCHKIGYAPRRRPKKGEDRESSPDYTPEILPTKRSAPSKIPVSHSDKVFLHQNQKQRGSPDYTPKFSLSNKSAPSKISVSHSDKVSLHQNQNQGGNEPSRHPSPAVNYNGNVGENRDKSQRISGVGASSSESTSPFSGNIRDYDLQTTVTMRDANGSSQKGFSAQRTLPIERTLSRDSSLEARRTEAEDNCSPSGKAMQVVTHPPLRSHNVNRNIAVTPTSNYGNVTVPSNYGNPSFSQLVEENRELKERLRRREEEILGDLVQDLECVRTRCRTLEAQVEEEKRKYDLLNREQESIIAIFTEEKERRDVEEHLLRKKLKEAEATSKNLVEKVTQLQLENMRSMGHKWGQ
ncbi:protein MICRORCHIDIA 7-like isoform X2 [Cynara cardunculus var. scolymus]|uniref:protein MICRORCHIDIA 7-like isoform X2 n=1 Tax=Cynara cardunculus var. scolymus TaxID=59895 RepID=UPI000D626EC9|nr:protein MICRORCHIDIA 7-like isoform X2 [Cynara cardunculus var. scolymus]